MPRQSRKQTTIRAGAGDSNVSMPADVVSSYSPYVQYASVRHDRSVGAAEIRVGEALSGFAKTVGQVAVNQYEADTKRRRLKGQADALTNPIPEDWAKHKAAVLADPEKGEEYFRAFSKQAAKIAGIAKANALADELERRTDITDVASFNKFYEESTRDDLTMFSELGEDEATIEYAGVLEEQEFKLRDVVEKRHAVAVYDETEANFNMTVQHDFERLVNRGASGSELVDFLVAKRKEGLDVLLTSDDINEALRRGVGEYAESTGRPELLNIFDVSHADSNDPTKRVPGLAFSKVHSAAIQDHRVKAQKQRDLMTAQVLKDQQYSAEKHILGLIRDGKSNEAELAIDMMEKNGVLEPSTAISYYKSLFKVSEKEARIANNVVKLTNGNMAIPSGERKEAMQAYGDSVMEKAMALGTAEAVHEATKDIVATGAQLGVLYPEFAASLKHLNLYDPEQFAASMEISAIVDAMAPAVYVDNTSPEFRAKVDMANRMLERGIKQGEIMLNIQELYTPEAVAKRKQLMGTPTEQAQRKAEIRDRVNNVDSWLWFDGKSYANADVAVDWIANTAADYMALGGGSYEDAVAFAEKEYKANHVELDLTNGESVYVYRGHLGLPENIQEKMQWFTDSFTQEVEGLGNLEPGVSYYLRPDPRSRHSDEREFLVVDTLGRPYLEQRDGLAVPMRIGERELDKQWRQGMATEAQDEQAKRQLERQRRDARAMGNRSYYGVTGDELRRRYREIGMEPPEGADVTPPKPREAGEPSSSLTPPVSEASKIVSKWEGFRDTAYAATEHERKKGIWTIGFGETEGVREGMVRTKEEAFEYLNTQLQNTAEALQSAVGPVWQKLNDFQQAAVISLAYNVDKDVVGQLKRSHALASLRRGDFEAFKRQAFDPKIGFVRQGGKVLRGLVKRRAAELALFNKETSSS